MSKPTMTTKDNSDEINTWIKSLQKGEVLVGIPSSDSDRQPVNGEDPEINNAGILFINEYGSEDGKIPASRPMATGIKNAQEAIAEEFKKCAQAVLTKGPAALSLYYERVGSIASNSVKKVINDQQGFEPPADSTLAARAAEGFKGKKRLIVTGQMRNAITYVVKA